MNTDFIARRVFETPPQRGFARHLLCDLGKLGTAFGCHEHAFCAALTKWRWQPPPLAYRHEQLPRPLHLISAAPLRLRHDIEEHLLAALLDWSCDTFYNAPPNTQLQDTIVYKSLAMLNIIEQSATSAQFFLIGTAAPRDVYVLLGIKLFCCGILSTAGYRRFLQPQHDHTTPQLDLPTPGSRNIAALLIPRPARALLTAANPLNGCLTLFDDVQQISRLSTEPPTTDDRQTPRWQRRNEHDIIDMASELLDQ